MRRVAAALDTGAASLYVYVAGREGLLEAMLDRVIATVELEAPDPSRWRAQLHSLLDRMHEALVAHPGIAAMTLADPPTTEAVLRLTENLLGILLAGGLDPQDAAWACDILVLLVNGRRPRGRRAAPSRPQRRRPPRAGRRDLQDLRRPAARPVPPASPPTPRSWSPATARSGSASPSTSSSTALRPDRPAADESAVLKVPIEDAAAGSSRQTCDVLDEVTSARSGHGARQSDRVVEDVAQRPEPAAVRPAWPSRRARVSFISRPDRVDDRRRVLPGEEAGSPRSPPGRLSAPRRSTRGWPRFAADSRRPSRVGGTGSRYRTARGPCRPPIATWRAPGRSTTAPCRSTGSGTSPRRSISRRRPV